MLKRSYKSVFFLLIFGLLYVTAAFSILDAAYIIVIPAIIALIPAITLFNTVTCKEDGLLVENAVYKRKQFLPFKEVDSFELSKEPFIFYGMLNITVHYPDETMESFHIGLNPATEIPHLIKLLPEGVRVVDRTKA